MLLFLDVDGVLLGRRHPRDPTPCLAGDCEAFVDYILAHFDCYWLTTHCRGDADAVIDYLRPFADEALIDKLRRIQPTNFRTFKTEALHGDFVWIDDAPTRYEFDYLDQQGMLQRWLQVDTRRDFRMLEKLMADLEVIRNNGFER